GGRSVQAVRIVYSQRERGTTAYGAGITGWYAPEVKYLTRLKPDYAGGPTVDMIAFGSLAAPPPTLASRPTTQPAVPPPAHAVAVRLKGRAGAKVSVRDGEYTLDASGDATITLPPGRHEIAATRDGFEPWRSTIDIGARETRVTYPIVMSPRAAPQ